MQKLKLIHNERIYKLFLINPAGLDFLLLWLISCPLHSQRNVCTYIISHGNWNCLEWEKIFIVRDLFRKLLLRNSELKSELVWCCDKKFTTTFMVVATVLLEKPNSRFHSAQTLKCLFFQF